MTTIVQRGSRVNSRDGPAAALAAQETLPLGLEPGRDETAARSLLALLGGAAYGAIQDDTGGYRGRRRLNVETLAAHFRGEISVALRCADGDTARIIGWDLDERAPERMRALAAVLDRHGLLERAVATEGSDAGRGKVVLFVRAIFQTAAVNFAAAILDQARRSPEWGIERDGTVESRPRIREGGLLRIGGRNVKRHGPIERVFSLATGEPIAFSQIGIADLDLPAEPLAVPMPQVPPYVVKMLESGLTWPKNGSAGIRKVLARLARHALHSGRGEAVFTSWCQAIRSKSPALAGASPKTGDVRGALNDGRIFSAWRAAVETRGSSWDTTPSGARRADVMSQQGHTPLDEVELAVRDFVAVRDLHPDGFELSYREISRRLGWPRMRTWRTVQRLVEANRLVIVDRGTQGERGDRTVFALADGRSAVEVEQAAKARPVVKKRVRKRKEYAERIAALATEVVVDDLADRRQRRGRSETPSSSVGDASRHRSSGPPAASGPAKRPDARTVQPGAAGNATDVHFDFTPIFAEAAEQRARRKSVRSRPAP